MKPMRTLTDPLNSELAARMRQRLAADPGLEDSPMVAPTAPQPEAMQYDTPEDTPASEHLEQLYFDAKQAHDTMKNLSGELARRKLTDAQLKNVGMCTDWLGVTKSIAIKYGEALVHMEHLLAELADKIAAYRAEYKKDPDFLGE